MDTNKINTVAEKMDEVKKAAITTAKEVIPETVEAAI